MVYACYASIHCISLWRSGEEGRDRFRNPPRRGAPGVEGFPPLVVFHFNRRRVISGFCEGR